MHAKANRQAKNPLDLNLVSAPEQVNNEHKHAKEQTSKTLTSNHLDLFWVWIMNHDSNSLSLSLSLCVCVWQNKARKEVEKEYRGMEI